MLYYEALQQLSRDRVQQREREARAERLALAVRGRQYRRRRWFGLAAGLELLPRARERQAQQRAGA
jgi:hypothetical protein